MSFVAIVVLLFIGGLLALACLMVMMAIMEYQEDQKELIRNQEDKNEKVL